MQIYYAIEIDYMHADMIEINLKIKLSIFSEIHER